MTIDDPRFKRQANGKWAGGALIVELSRSPEIEPLYTIGESDIEEGGKYYPSLHRLYMEMEDITEYEFAKKYLGSWEQWQAITSLLPFQKTHEKWKQELDAKIKSRLIKTMMLEGMSESKNSFAANKFILERGWEKQKESSGKGRGRPSKAEIERQAKMAVVDDDKIKEAYNRMKDWN